MFFVKLFKERGFTSSRCLIGFQDFFKANDIAGSGQFTGTYSMETIKGSLMMVSYKDLKVRLLISNVFVHLGNLISNKQHYYNLCKSAQIFIRIF